MINIPFIGKDFITQDNSDYLYSLINYIPSDYDKSDLKSLFIDYSNNNIKCLESVLHIKERTNADLLIEDEEAKTIMSMFEK